MWQTTILLRECLSNIYLKAASGKSAVLIVEDDAQNGADHVDAHRTTACLAGPL
jgi:hypothetical protein